METTNKIPDDNMQERLMKFLDTNFLPILREEWKPQISIYEIGARPADGLLGEVIVWLRSTSLINHVKELIEKNMSIDAKTRQGIDDPGYPRLHDDTVLIRLSKKVDTEKEGSVDLIVELFQVFGKKSEAKKAYNILNNTYNPKTPSETN